MKAKDTELLAEIGRRIRDQRLSLGLSQGELALEFGCAQSRLSGIEQGTRDPGSDFYAWFAMRTETSLDQLILGKASGARPAEPKTLSRQMRAVLKEMMDIYLNSDLAKDEIEDFLKTPGKIDVKNEMCTSRERMYLNLFRQLDPDKHDQLYEYMEALQSEGQS